MPRRRAGEDGAESGRRIQSGYGPQRLRNIPQSAEATPWTILLGSDSIRRSCRALGLQEGASSEERSSCMTYEKPEVTDFGSIVDHTFTTPHGTVKGCTVNCHLDNFNEQSALTAT
jgi:hypothetical protein